VLSELKEWKKEQAEKGKILGSMFNKENLVCCRIDGTPLSSSLLQKKFKKILKDAGLPDIRFHDLRHSNATLLLKNHVPAKIASEMLGHSNISTTLDIYSHVQTDMQKEAVNVVNNMLNIEKNKLEKNKPSC
jgi:integrase